MSCPGDQVTTNLYKSTGLADVIIASSRFFPSFDGLPELLLFYSRLSTTMTFFFFKYFFFFEKVEMRMYLLPAAVYRDGIKDRKNSSISFQNLAPTASFEIRTRRSAPLF